MVRLTPFILGSIGAHLLLVGVLCEHLFFSPSSSEVLEINALFYEPPVEPEVEPLPPEPEPVVEPPQPPVKTKRPRRRPPRPQPQAEPEPQLEEQAEEPPQQQPAPVVSESQAQNVTPISSAPSQSGAAISGSGRSSSVASRGGSGVASRRRGNGSRGSQCRAAATAVSRQLRSVAPYPSWANSMGLEGQVLLNLRIGRDGRARGVRITQTSGYSRLDRYAINGARRLTGLPQGCSRPISVPIRFHHVRN